MRTKTMHICHLVTNKLYEIYNAAHMYAGQSQKLNEGLSAACALARGNNDNGVPLVLDPHDKTLKDDLWHATFAGSVHIVTATIGHQHRGAVVNRSDCAQPPKYVIIRSCPAQQNGKKRVPVEKSN